MRLAIFIMFTLPLWIACNDLGHGGRRTDPTPVIRENQDDVTTGVVVLSQIHHVRGIAPFNSVQEASRSISMPDGYEEVPRQHIADDGLGDSTVVHAVRAITPCGLGPTFKSISERASDCSTLNGANAHWLANENGNAGEGNWRLITRSATGEEVWWDNTSGYLWSDVIQASSDWCKASGNTEGISGDGGVVDCAALGAGISLCQGAVLSQLPTTEVSWRLPTRGDFLQADLNGARFVLPSTNLTYWSATVNGAHRDEAWGITMMTGILTSDLRSNAHAVRCLGRRLK